MKKNTIRFWLVALMLLPCSSRGQELPQKIRPDAEVIDILLDQDLGKRRFPFGAAAGKAVLPLDPANEAHRRIQKAVHQAVSASMNKLNQPDSAMRGLRRINEASRFFEDEIRAHFDQVDGIQCEIPTNAQGRQQRVGYPDLRIVESTSGVVFYLDPKLVEQGAIDSTLRTFYFEPRKKSGKILDDAIHLLVGIEHDGKDGDWTFVGYRLVDLSTITLRLKAEFQASNADLYQGADLFAVDKPSQTGGSE